MQSDIKEAERATYVKLTPDAQRELDAKLAELKPRIAQQTKSMQVYPITLSTGGMVSRFADLNVSTDAVVPSTSSTQTETQSSSSSSSETFFSALHLDDPWQSESPAALEASLAWSDADVAALTAPSSLEVRDLSDEELAAFEKDMGPMDFIEDREERRLAEGLADEIIRLATPTTLARVAPPDTVRGACFIQCGSHGVVRTSAFDLISYACLCARAFVPHACVMPGTGTLCPSQSTSGGNVPATE
jgi:hypothetical protein